MAVPSATEIQQAVEKALNWCRPTGSYILFAGKTVPDGYLLCNGAAVSRTTYAKLFAVIGTTYGAGDGSTTFNLPDLNERFLQGTSTLSSVGTKREASLPAIIAVIGTTYGAGDGSTTFNLPDLNERFLQGTSTLSSVGTKREASLPAISGRLISHNNAPDGNGGTSWGSGLGCFSGDVPQKNYSYGTKTAGAGSFGEYHFEASRSSSAYKGSTVQPLALLALVAIRY